MQGRRCSGRESSAECRQLSWPGRSTKAGENDAQNELGLMNKDGMRGPGQEIT